MNIGIAYANKIAQVWMKIEVPDSSTVKEAIELSGIINRFPDIDLKKQKVGIYGKFVKLGTPLKDGDRVEIYRPLIADPKTVPRRKLANDDDDDDDDDDD
jgi:hypothetical protein